MDYVERRVASHSSETDSGSHPGCIMYRAGSNMNELVKALEEKFSDKDIAIS